MKNILMFPLNNEDGLYRVRLGTHEFDVPKDTVELIDCFLSFEGDTELLSWTITLEDTVTTWKYLHRGTQVLVSFKEPMYDFYERVLIELSST